MMLGERNNTHFQHNVKTLLLEHDVYEPVYRRGIVWMKGLVAKLPSADEAKVATILKQHYENRKAYRKRQQENAQKKWQREGKITSLPSKTH